MRISHEAIYQALYVAGPGRAQTRAGRRACAPAGRCASLELGPGSRRGRHVTAEVLISERPAEAEDRAVPGHWEGDLLIGLERSAIGTVVERKTRFTMLVHLPREEGYQQKRARSSRTDRPLAGYGANHEQRAHRPMPRCPNSCAAR